MSADMAFGLGIEFLVKGVDVPRTAGTRMDIGLVLVVRVGQAFSAFR